MLRLQYGVEVLAKSGTIRDILVKMAELTGLPSNELVLTDYYSSKFWKVFHESEATGNISQSTDTIVGLLLSSVVCLCHLLSAFVCCDLPLSHRVSFGLQYAYHVPTNGTSDPAVPVMLFPAPYSYSYYSSSNYSSSSSRVAFGLPFFIRAPKDATEEVLRNLIDPQLQ